MLRLAGPNGGWVDVWLLSADADALRETARRKLGTILSGYLGLAPEEIPIVKGPQGKPRLDPELGSPLAFNLTHSGTLAAVAVASGGEVGVDVERCAPRERLPILADAMLAPAERRWFERLPATRRTDAFFDLWTAKEACSKLIGRGLTMPFSAIEVASPEARLSAVTVDHPSAPDGPCSVQRLPVASGYSGAVALAV